MAYQDSDDRNAGQLSCTHTSLRHASRQLTQLFDEAMAPAGLTSPQAQLVSQIQELGGEPGGEGPALQALSKRLGIQISALTHALKPLVRDGLVELHADSRDRRTKRAVLTPLGLKQTQMMFALWETTNQRVRQALGESATEQLRELADRVASPDFIEAFAKTDPARKKS